MYDVEYDVRTTYERLDLPSLDCLLGSSGLLRERLAGGLELLEPGERDSENRFGGEGGRRGG
jgi:hypothetical protein